LPIGIKAALDGSLDRELERDRNRTAALDELERKLRAHELDAVVREIPEA